MENKVSSIVAIDISLPVVSYRRGIRLNVVSITTENVIVRMFIMMMLIRIQSGSLGIMTNKYIK